MTPERWLEVKALFTTAMELAPGAREAHVAAACGDDAQLRDEVLSLVASAAEPDDADSHSLPGLRSAIAGEASRALGTRSARGAQGDAELQAALATALGQQYEILRLLGRGGMGAVYLARDRALERFVAVKVLRPDLADVQAGRERFRREARIAAHLSHPGILPLHTFGEIGGLWYFVMGYVRGVTLAERLRVEGRMEPGEACRIVTELAEALECAHRSGVIHRDIKPANVLLDDDSGRAVLADFGIAKVRDAGDSLTGTGAMIGTPSFMSPEQASGAAHLDERSDIWSLGAVGYAMLAGREPRAANGSGAPHDRRDAITPLSDVAPAVPAELAQVVMRALARDPASRWPSAHALRDALARSTGDNSVEVPDSLRELPTFGPYAVLWAAFWAVLAARPGRSLGDRTLLLFVALIVPIGLVLHLWNVAGDGLTPVGLLRVACWPPEWWGMWWPRPLRRPNDLWRRLPRPARATRVAMSAFIVALPALILAREWVEAKTGRSFALLGEGWFVTVEGVLLAVGAAIVGASLAWAYARGLTFSQSVRVLFGTTSPSPRWREPAMARLLRAPDGRQAPAPDDAPAHLRAIEVLLAHANAREVVGTAQRDPLASARRVADAIRASDAEIAALEKSADTAELDRLTMRSGALAAQARPSPEHLQLMELLERQLDVVHRMQARREELKAARARLMRLLRVLWAQVQAADAASGQAGEADGDAARARLDALLREMHAAVESHS